MRHSGLSLKSAACLLGRWLAGWLSNSASNWPRASWASLATLAGRHKAQRRWSLFERRQLLARAPKSKVAAFKLNKFNFIAVWFGGRRGGKGGGGRRKRGRSRARTRAIHSSVAIAICTRCKTRTAHNRLLRVARGSSEGVASLQLAALHSAHCVLRSVQCRRMLTRSH